MLTAQRYHTALEHDAETVVVHPGENAMHDDGKSTRRRPDLVPYLVCPQPPPATYLHMRLDLFAFFALDSFAGQGGVSSRALQLPLARHRLRPCCDTQEHLHTAVCT